jgi:hypothetical protein
MTEPNGLLLGGLADEVYEAIRRRVEAPLITVARINQTITAISVTVAKDGKPSQKTYYVSIEEI